MTKRRGMVSIAIGLALSGLLVGLLLWGGAAEHPIVSPDERSARGVPEVAPVSAEQGQPQEADVTFTGQEGHLSGRVLTSDGVRPVRGALVALLPLNAGRMPAFAATNDLGDFVVRARDGDRYRMFAWDDTEGCYDETISIPTASDGNPVSLEIRLLGASRQPVVTTRANTDPLPRASVIVTVADPAIQAIVGWSARGVSDERGLCTVTVPNEVALHFVALHDQASQGPSMTVPRAPGPTVPVLLPFGSKSLAPSTVAQGLVVDVHGEPVPDLTVSLRPVDPSGGPAVVMGAKTNVAGEFANPEALGGQWETFVLARKVGDLTSLNRAISNADGTSEIRVTKSGAVRLACNWADGTPRPDFTTEVGVTVLNASVEGVSIEENRWLGFSFGGEIGRSVQGLLPPGNYSLLIHGADFISKQYSDVTIRSGETTDLGSVTVMPGARLSGTVEWPDGGHEGRLQMVFVPLPRQGAAMQEPQVPVRLKRDGTFDSGPRVPEGDGWLGAFDKLGLRGFIWVAGLRGTEDRNVNGLAIEGTGRLILKSQGTPGATQDAILRREDGGPVQWDSGDGGWSMGRLLVQATMNRVADGVFVKGDLLSGRYIVTIGGDKVAADVRAGETTMASTKK